MVATLYCGGVLCIIDALLSRQITTGSKGETGRGDLDLQSHTNPAKRKTVNPKIFPTRAPIIRLFWMLCQPPQPHDSTKVTAM